MKSAESELRPVFRFIEHPNLAPRYNIAPTQAAPVVRERREPKGERTIQALRWGLVPPWADGLKSGAPLINARAESLLEKRAFAAPFRRRRCLVPADGYYQWREGDASKRPYLVARRDGAPFAFAGIWDRWGPRQDAKAAIDSFAIVTTDANDFLRPFHHRMPVVLTADAYDRWLDPEEEPEKLIALLAPAPNDLLRAAPLGRAVNSARAEGEALIAPEGPALLWQGGSGTDAEAAKN